MPAATRRKRVRIHEAEKTGELNIVPYLDIIVNLTLFMLATMAGFVKFGIVNVSAPSYGAPTTATAGDKKDKEKKELLLTVAIAKNGIFVAGSGGVLGGEQEQEGGLQGVDASRPPTIPALPKPQFNDPQKCVEQKGGAEKFEWIGGQCLDFQYRMLTSKLVDVKKAYPDEHKVIIMADQEIPYNALINTMEATRTDGEAPLFYDVVLAAM